MERSLTIIGALGVFALLLIMLLALKGMDLMARQGATRLVPVVDRLNRRYGFSKLTVDVQGSGARQELRLWYRTSKYLSFDPEKAEAEAREVGRFAYDALPEKERSRIVRIQVTREEHTGAGGCFEEVAETHVAFEPRTSGPNGEAGSGNPPGEDPPAFYDK